MPDIPDISQIDLTHLAPPDRAVMSEYLRRKALRKKGESFLSFSKHVYPEFVIEEVHVLIARHFEMLRTGEIDRLMIMMPPRTGKSYMTSELLPAWWEGHLPSDKILHASYASTLVEKFGRKIRNLLQLPEYHEIFPGTCLSKDSKSAAQWATTQGGEYNAVGVGGGVAGKGGNLICVSETARLYTPRGAVSAREVIEGDVVATSSGWGRVTKKYLTTHQKSVMLNTRLQVSSDHRIFVQGKGWVLASELRIGDCFVTLTFWRKIWLRMSGRLQSLRESLGRR